MVDSRAEIEKVARRLLELADADGRLPTPVDDIVQAAGLVEADESLLSPRMLERAPLYLRRAMRDIVGKIRGVLDRKEKVIHLPPDLMLEVRRRFTKLHEVFHHVLKWQKVLVLVDTDETLSPEVRTIFEMEASYGAAHVLFQGNRYGKQIADLPIGIGAVACVAPGFGASLRSGLRRYVESDRAPMIGFVLDMAPMSGEPLRFRRHEVIASLSYIERFGTPRWYGDMRMSTYPFLVEAIAAGAVRNTAVAGEWRAIVDNIAVTFRTEFYCTGHNTLGLIWLPPEPRRKRRGLRLVA